MRTVASIVEGHGEVKALPILLRRIAGELHDVHDVQFTPPYRASRSTVIKPGELERLVRLVRRECGPSGGILVVLDADDDCPATFGPELLARVQAVDTGPLGVVLANREFEAWFLAAAISIAGFRDLAADLVPPSDPDDIRNAKGWLRDHMPPGRSYSETTDQPALSARMDLGAALASRSFQKLLDEMVKILTVLA